MRAGGRASRSAAAGRSTAAPARSARPVTTASGSSPGASSACSRDVGTDTRTGNCTAYCSATPFDTPVRPRRPAAGAVAVQLADPTLSDQAHRARRLFAIAHRGQPTYFRRKFPDSERLVWTHRDMWLVPLKPFADGQLLPGIAGAQFILPDGTKRFQRDLRLPGLATSPRWRAAGPLLLTEGVTSALAVALCITDPPLGVLACLSRNGLLETARRLGRRPAAVIADHDHPDENGVRPGIDAAVRTGLPWWAPATEGFDAWDAWNAGETAPLVEWVRSESNLVTTAAGPSWPSSAGGSWPPTSQE